MIYRAMLFVALTSCAVAQNSPTPNPFYLYGKGQVLLLICDISPDSTIQNCRPRKGVTLDDIANAFFRVLESQQKTSDERYDEQDCEFTRFLYSMDQTLQRKSSLPTAQLRHCGITQGKSRKETK